MKTSGGVEKTARRYARPLLVGLVAFIVLVSAWTPLEFARIAERWFSWPDMLYLSPVPLITVALTVSCWLGLAGRRPTVAFNSAVGLFIISFAGFAARRGVPLVSHRRYLAGKSRTFCQPPTQSPR
jgi:cytochrome d ubiquinol oxidase subunit II